MNELTAALEELAATVDSYCDHEDDDPDCLDSLHALSRTIRDKAAALAAEPRLDAERLAMAICDYAGKRQRLVFPLSRVRTVAYAIADYYADPSLSGDAVMEERT